MEVERFVIASLLLIGILVISGCVGNRHTNVTRIVENLPQVQVFLEENPGADISIVRLSSDYLLEKEDEIPQDCVPAIDIEQAHYRARVVDEPDEMEIWLRGEDMEVMCALREGKDDPEKDEEDPNFIEKAEEKIKIVTYSCAEQEVHVYNGLDKDINMTIYYEGENLGTQSLTGEEVNRLAVAEIGDQDGLFEVSYDGHVVTSRVLRCG